MNKDERLKKKRWVRLRARWKKVTRSISQREKTACGGYGWPFGCKVDFPLYGQIEYTEFYVPRGVINEWKELLAPFRLKKEEKSPEQ